MQQNYKGTKTLKIIGHTVFFDQSNENWTTPPKKYPIGAIYKVKYNFPDLWGVDYGATVGTEFLFCVTYPVNIPDVWSAVNIPDVWSETPCIYWLNFIILLFMHVFCVSVTLVRLHLGVPVPVNI